ncbi:hypothetical protein CCACVL1_01848 [Corchorus capsularis]|uniref:Uncharacterized protein n=1 Tax=Corchorus capsularis TaxID=210143 RepID=A0A1R3KF14_COCAP|nr:hypothetical protein CCACVL1_01848 [Corchorus capsularis]
MKKRRLGSIVKDGESEKVRRWWQIWKDEVRRWRR